MLSYTCLSLYIFLSLDNSRTFQISRPRVCRLVGGAPVITTANEDLFRASDLIGAAVDDNDFDRAGKTVLRRINDGATFLEILINPQIRVTYHALFNR